MNVRPHQRDGLCRIPHIIAAHAEQHGVKAFLGHIADGRRFHCRNAKRASQRGQCPATVWIRRIAQIIGDQPDLLVARACVDQPVDQRGESLHQLSSSSSRPTRSSARAFNWCSSHQRPSASVRPWVIHVSVGRSSNNVSVSSFQSA